MIKVSRKEVMVASDSQRFGINHLEVEGIHIYTYLYYVSGGIHCCNSFAH